jgi:hypothetical protein
MFVLLPFCVPTTTLRPDTRLCGQEVAGSCHGFADVIKFPQFVSNGVLPFECGLPMRIAAQAMTDRSKRTSIET